ncbi:alpha/beta hydrolase [Jejubacter calystegiae]|uniref:Alpha/beta hydrolase n=1 Tax=Jejubacter calystegiae TaxID=2579935 RepID=A0A4P8YNC6_9ENTR|nr:alpha/beta fold hydrolase [Jejubacter calystegiae]QCT22359.1 alpha/beta hydrolase [Jejubacter calystegiae]
MSTVRTIKGIELIDEALYVPAQRSDIQLHVRHRRPAAMTTFSPQRTIVLVHGATYSSGSLYDVPFNGISFLDYLAAAGYDVYALDVRGYGRSTRPPEMDQPAGQHPPLAGTDDGVADLGSVVDFVLKHRHLEQLNIFGMSWGGTVAAAWTSRNNARVHKLALVAPQWLNDQPTRIDSGGDPGAWRLIAVRETLNGWLSAAPEHARDRLIPAGWFDQWADATLAEDPWSQSHTPGKIRAVSGPIQDIRDYWRVGRKYYQPADIRVPVLLVHGEWDIDVPLAIARVLFSELENAPWRQWLEIGESTHMLLLERHRMLAWNAIRDFYDRDYHPE